jgi:hypothetical protein
MPQYSSLTFAIAFKDLTNNHYKWLLQPNMTICTIESRKALLNAKLRMTHERRTCGLRFEV